MSSVTRTSSATANARSTETIGRAQTGLAETSDETISDYAAQYGLGETREVRTMDPKTKQLVSVSGKGLVNRYKGKVTAVHMMQPPTIIPGDVVELAAQFGKFVSATTDGKGGVVYYYGHGREFSVHVRYNDQSEIPTVAKEAAKGLGKRTWRTIIIASANRNVAIVGFEKGDVVVARGRDGFPSAGARRYTR